MSQTAPRTPIRPTVLRLISEAETAGPDHPLTDEAYFLSQLRAAITAGESPIDRLRNRYGPSRHDPLCRLYARYSD